MTSMSNQPHTERGHSSVGASSAYRWMNCPASATLSKQVKSTSSSFADEGTAAHELAERCLLGNVAPKNFLGTSIKVNSVDYEVTQEMVDAIDVYVDACKKRIGYLNLELKIEVKFNLNWLEPGMFGTCDAVAEHGLQSHPNDWQMSVIDLKYGAGKPVYAEENPQLMYYALGALGAPKGGMPREVTMCIVQPRCAASGVTEWTISTEELYDWAYNKLRPAVQATRVPYPVHKFGDWCHWCPATAICPHLAEMIGEITAPVLVTPEVQPLELPRVEDLSLEKKAWIAEHSGLVKNWMEAVGKSVTEAAMSGARIQGYKLVQRKLGNRRWVNPKTVQNMYGGVLGDKLYEERKIVSPAALERVLAEVSGLAKADKKIKDEVTGLTQRFESGLELRPDSDKRPAVEIQNSLMDVLDAEFGEEV